ncbi:hypothetical protein LINPERHAP2_LOCUS5007 [Linum perenne]
MGVTSGLPQIKTLEILRLMFVDLGLQTENFQELETLEIINCSTPINMKFFCRKIEEIQKVLTGQLRDPKGDRSQGTITHSHALH